MPAPKTNLIPHSCFGYYDQNFIECMKKCKISDSCKNATNNPQCEQVRKIFKFKKQQIQELVKEWKTQ